MPDRPQPPRARVEPPGEEEVAVAGSENGVNEAVEALLDEVGEPRPEPARESGRLRGRVALITGGSSGIGRAVALELAESGVHISFCFLDTGAQARLDAQAVARELAQLEVRCYFRSCDVRDSSDVQAFVRETREELGGLHILVNNAGIGRDRALWRMQDHEWEAVLRTNLDGAFFFSRSVAPWFRAREEGKIVNIASVHGIRAEFGLSNYAASKAGLIGLTRSMAMELGPRNINVNAVAPGYIRTTRLTGGVSPEILDRARERSALKRLGDPRDVAAAVRFLVSEGARHITGVVLPVDGGYLL